MIIKFKLKIKQFIVAKKINLHICKLIKVENNFKQYFKCACVSVKKYVKT